MKVCVCYIYPLIGSDHYLNLALRFIRTYHEHPAGYPHDTIIMCNGNKPNEEVEFMFGGLENCRVLHGDNCGKDCSSYQKCAWDNPHYDAILFFGASTYIKGRNWLSRMMQAREKHGDTLYGTMGNRGAEHIGVHAHIRTTAFLISPKLMNEHPLRVTDPSHRYAFEHGPDCLTSYVKKRGLIPYVVGWSGEYRWEHWDHPEGFHQGSQRDLIAGDRNSEPPHWHCP